MATSIPPGASTDRNAATGFTPHPLDWIAPVLMIVGALNWGLVGAFNFDLVAALFGHMTMASRIAYILVGLAAMYSLRFLARFGRHTAV